MIPICPCYTLDIAVNGSRAQSPYQGLKYCPFDWLHRNRFCFYHANSDPDGYVLQKVQTLCSLYLWPPRWVSVHLHLYSVATAKHPTCARGLIFEDFEVFKSSEVTNPRDALGKSEACCHLQLVPERMCDTRGSPSVQAVLWFLKVQCRNPLWALMCLSRNRSRLDSHP